MALKSSNSHTKYDDDDGKDDYTDDDDDDADGNDDDDKDDDDVGGGGGNYNGGGHDDDGDNDAHNYCRLKTIQSCQPFSRQADTCPRSHRYAKKTPPLEALQMLIQYSRTRIVVNSSVSTTCSTGPRKVPGAMVTI